MPVLPTVAVPGDPLLHVPPAVASESMVPLPAQNDPKPVIAAGDVFTVMAFTAKQVPSAQVMFTVPAAIPVTTPEDEPTVAIDVLLLDHVTPGVISISVAVLPVQTVLGPAIGNGVGRTVTVRVARQAPAGTV